MVEHIVGFVELAPKGLNGHTHDKVIDSGVAGAISHLQLRLL